MALILIAAADASVSGLLAAQLESFGHTCHLAENGKVAIGLVRDTEYDLIISDIRMPVMDGLTFLRHVIGRIESTTPCMILTEFNDVDHAIKAMKVGAYDFIRKPWNMQEMRISVDRALQRRADLKVRRDYQADLERRIGAAVAGIKNAYDKTVIGFAALLEGKDTSTAEHCVRVRDLCSRLGREMNLGTDRLRDLELGAMLHDVGKCRVPDEILNKPGKLSPAEWDVMRRHPEYGAEICERIAFLRGAAEIIRSHHERWDGSGYPAGLRGDAIPLAARIVMVAEAYDTITSEFPYKAAQTPENALSRIRDGAGTQFDPDIVAAFERIYPELVARPLAATDAKRCSHCRGRGVIQYSDRRFVPSDVCRPCEGTGKAPEVVPVGPPRMTIVPEPLTPMSASIHLFSDDECLSLTSDEAEVLERMGLLEFEGDNPSVRSLKAALSEGIRVFRRCYTDLPTLLRDAAADWFGDHTECHNCPPQVVRAYGYTERLMREHPEIRRESRRRAVEFDRLVKERYAVYTSDIDLFQAADARWEHDHGLCADDACPSFIVGHLELTEQFHAWRRARTPPGAQA